MNPYILFLLFFCQSIISERINYANPVIRLDAPDPSVIKADNNWYYLYATLKESIEV